MYQTRRELPQRQGKTASSSAAFVYVGVFLSILMCVAFVSGIYLVLSTMLGSPLAPQVAHAVQIERHVKVNLNIVINQQGMQKDWPGYAPNNLVVPANSLVTVTLRDYDLGDTPLPSNSPFTKVQGTVGNANVDGKAYSYLASEKFHTSKAGTYTFQCLNPCGTGSTGWMGPMITRGYMMGSLTVQ